MNDKLVLIDTDILSYILKRRENVYKKAYDYLKINRKFTISCITYYECIRGYKAINASKRLRLFHDFLNISDILYLNHSILEKAGEIYGVLKNNGKLPGEFDILIGATAIFHNLILVTNNEKHYTHLTQFSLELENWNKSD